MTDGLRTAETGSDLDFAERMRQHHIDSQKADLKLDEAARAVAEKGGLAPEAQAFLDASLGVAKLSVEGDWLTASDSVLNVSQKAALVSVKDNLVLEREKKIQQLEPQS